MPAPTMLITSLITSNATASPDPRLSCRKPHDSPTAGNQDQSGTTMCYAMQWDYGRTTARQPAARPADGQQAE